MQRRMYLWDFFGPNAHGTATHFREHLLKFMAQHEISDCECGVRSERPGHAAAFCIADVGLEPALVRALRPQRALEPDAP